MRLEVLQADVEARCGATRAAYPDWPCRKGCDRCCRSLAKVPEATAAEWQLVELSFGSLPADLRSEIERRIDDLRCQGAPFTCPFLDREAGDCLVYESRPIACRTYGYYVEREAGLYCGEIAALVQGGEADSVVWGNQCAIDARLDELGPRIPVTAHFGA